MAFIRRKILRQELGRNKSIIDYAYNLAKEDFQNKKQQLLEDFDNHEVTQEIKGGYKDPLNAPNSTNTTFGRGNLYTFIGFEYSAGDPTVPVRETLESSVELKQTSLGARYKGDIIEYKFPINVPRIDGELANAAPMPFGSSISWLLSIEKGISGLNSYIYWKLFDKSRSTAGIQAKNPDGSIREIRNVNNGNSSPIKYISDIIKRFQGRFK